MSAIVHVVLVEWQDGADPAEADALVDRHLVPLPGVLTLDRGPSVSTEGLESGFDWALVIRFASADALAAYLPHPEHVVVGSFLQAHAARLVVFDVAAAR
ncbi:Dabb family protein [Amnibacterium kyonggiense]|nr:Dabb family protein [Amnibacterium kyonggiense]